MYNSSKSRFSEAETFVMWEFEECPIPAGVREIEVSENISRALKVMGYYGMVTFRGYGDIYSEHGKQGIGVFYTLYVSPEMRRQKILVDLLGLAIGRDRTRPLNLVLILGDISRHTGLLSAIRVLVSEGSCNVILSQPQNVSGQLPDGLDTVWLWETLAAQGRMVSWGTGIATLPPVPIQELLRQRRQSSGIRRIAKLPPVPIQELLLPKPRANTTNTAVFWDTEDCQIPDGLNAVVVSQNIRSALEKRNYGGTVSIYAYGDTNQIKAGLEKTRFVLKPHKTAVAHKGYLGTASICDTDALESTELMINHTPSGDKHARLEKIIIDSFSWALTNPAPANVMLILGDVSSHREFISAFYNFDIAHFSVLLAQPGIASSCYPVHIKWLWESLSVGGDPLRDDQTLLDDGQFLCKIDQSDSEDGQFEGTLPDIALLDDGQFECTLADQALRDDWNFGSDGDIDQSVSEDGQIKSSQRVDSTSVGSWIPKRFFTAGILVCNLIDYTTAGSRIPRYLLGTGSLVCTVVTFFLDR